MAWQSSKQAQNQYPRGTSDFFVLKKSPDYYVRGSV
jgi:hypothetical protein